MFLSCIDINFFMLIPLSWGWLEGYWSHSVALHLHQQVVLVAELMLRYCCLPENMAPVAAARDPLSDGRMALLLLSSRVRTAMSWLLQFY